VPRVRLVADDLTGALDGAAQLTGLGGAIAVPLDDALPAGSWAMDSCTREGEAATAFQRLASLAPWLRPAPGDIAFLKLDSLLRGHAGTEIAAVVETLPDVTCVVAPAFPHQGRFTRAGRQWLRDGSAPVGEDVAATLRAHGLPLALCQPGDAVPDRVSLWDAVDDAALDRIVAAGLARLVPPLWCGSAGLSGALARRLAAPPSPAPALPGPLLCLIGSDHAVARAQLAAADALAIADTAPASLEAIRLRLTAGAAVVGFSLPSGLDRAEAAAWIAGMLQAIADGLSAPGSLLAGGGATLRALCAALGTHRLDVVGQIEPGVPVSILRGGGWDGVPLVSKSGAFGPPDLLARLISPFLRRGSRA
jgi:D-threonate/D-erythronate kinase